MPGLARASALLWLFAAACSSPQASAPAPQVAPANLDVDAAAARAAVSSFLSLEARGSTDADTLLVPGADFIMTGVKVTARPRLAALNGPGDVVVEESSTGFAGSFAWVVVSYGFAGRTNDLADRARATFVLEKQRAGWKIRHVHSSMVARW